MIDRSGNGTIAILLFALLAGLTAVDAVMTVKATGDTRCLFVKCVVVK